MTSEVSKVEFTQRQLDWLDKQFPEMIATPATTTEEIRFRSAQRSVLYYIKNRVTHKVGD